MGNTLAILSGYGKESLEPWDHKVKALSNFSNEEEELKIGENWILIKKVF